MWVDEGFGKLSKNMKLASALFPHKGSVLFNKIYCLGGRDLMPHDVDQVIDETIEVAKTGKVRMILVIV